MRLFICFLGLSFALSINAVPVANNPYSPITERNVFGLVPMPTNPPADPKPVDPPAKITPNGIMSLFGQLQVLFKVAEPAKPDKPAHDQSYVMSEGERQDDIEVTKIDEAASMITFNNHGVIQQLPLTTAQNLPTPAAPAAPPNQFNNGVRNAHPFPPGQNNPGGNALMGNNSSYGSNPNSSPAPTYGMPNTGSSQSTETLSPEAQALLIEKNRIDTQEQVNQGLMPPLPPTAITPNDATGVGGAPLIAAPSIPSETK